MFEYPQILVSRWASMTMKSARGNLAVPCPFQRGVNPEARVITMFPCRTIRSRINTVTHTPETGMKRYSWDPMTARPSGGHIMMALIWPLLRTVVSEGTVLSNVTPDLATRRMRTKQWPTVPCHSILKPTICHWRYFGLGKLFKNCIITIHFSPIPWENKNKGYFTNYVT